MYRSLSLSLVLYSTIRVKQTGPYNFLSRLGNVSTCMIEHVCVTQSHKFIKALEYYRFLQYFIIAEEVKHAQQRRSQRALLFFFVLF